MPVGKVSSLNFTQLEKATYLVYQFDFYLILYQTCSEIQYKLQPHMRLDFFVWIFLFFDFLSGFSCSLICLYMYLHVLSASVFFWRNKKKATRSDRLLYPFKVNRILFSRRLKAHRKQLKTTKSSVASLHLPVLCCLFSVHVRPRKQNFSNGTQK